MSDKIEDYINIVRQQIRSNRVHKDISDEIKNHIDDQIKAFISNGIDEQTATIKAIEEMGDPVIVGVELDRIHRPKPEWSVIGLTIIMVLLGLVTQLFIPNNDILIRRIVFTVIGMFVLITVYFIDYSIIGKYPKIIFFILFGLGLILAIYTTTMGIYNRASLMFTQPIFSALILLFVPVFGGIIYSFRKKGYIGILSSGVFYLLPASICLVIGTDFGLFVQMTICCLIILTVAIIKDWFGAKKLNSLLLVFLPTLFTIIIVTISIFGNQYKTERIKAWLNPLEYESTTGYQASMIRKVIDNSKFIGEASVPEFKGAPIEKFIPSIELNNTLIYLIGKLGFAFALTIILLFVILIIRMFIVSFKQKNSLGFIISFAGTLIIASQGILYILCNLGLLLYFSGTFPLISYGNLSFVVNMCIIGLILSTFRNDNLIRNVKIDKKATTNSLFKFDDGKLIIDFNIKSRL